MSLRGLFYEPFEYTFLAQLSLRLTPHLRARQNILMLPFWIDWDITVKEVLIGCLETLKAIQKSLQNNTSQRA